MWSLTSTIRWRAARATLAGVVVTGAESKVPVSVHGRDRHEEGVNADVLGQQPSSLLEVARNVGEHLSSAVLHPPLDQGALHPGDEHAIGVNAVDQLVAQDRLTGDTRGFKVVDL